MNTKIDKFHSYDELVSFLNSAKVSTIDLTLDRVIKVLDILDNPQDKVKYVHIAGTNGKGSVLKYLESISIFSNLLVGSFTSPHLIDYTERIKLNNVDISKNEIVINANKVLNAQNSIEKMFLTTFEFLTVLAFLYFYEKKVDIALMEVGLGGRLDASNVIKKPVLSVITHINIDHKDILGDTIEKIAYEKAGIIKNSSKAIVASNNLGINVIKAKSEESNANLIIVDPSNYSFSYNNSELTQTITDKRSNISYKISMIGDHQIENFVLAIESAKLLEQENIISLKGVENSLEKTIWPGRAQYFKHDNILIDGAHNISGAQALKNLINKYFTNKNIIWIIGILCTKDYENILNTLISPNDKVYFTKLKYTSNDLNINLLNYVENKKLCNNIFYKSTLEESLKAAKNSSGSDDLIVISGSLYLIGEYISLKSTT